MSALREEEARGPLKQLTDLLGADVVFVSGEWGTKKPLATASAKSHLTSIVVVQASTNLSNPVWSPISTNILSDGTSYFSEPQWINYPRRFYRLFAQ
jgi:hypothetical protein